MVSTEVTRYGGDNVVTMVYLMVPVGEGMGDTNGEVSWASILSGGMVGCSEEEESCGAPKSSSREVKASLICVDGNLIIQLCGYVHTVLTL